MVKTSFLKLLIQSKVGPGVKQAYKSRQNLKEKTGNNERRLSSRKTRGSCCLIIKTNCLGRCIVVSFLHGSGKPGKTGKNMTGREFGSSYQNSVSN